jgi:hypothetical protein
VLGGPAPLPPDSAPLSDAASVANGEVAGP